MSDVQLQFFATDVWNALTALLGAQLSNVDVEQITDKDFNDQGELVFYATAVRVMYLQASFATMETQRTAYSKTHKFLVLAAAEDRTSQSDQAKASLQLSQQVEVILGGARIRLATNEISEPLTLVATETLPVQGIGVAYALAVEVEGAAGYDAPNAWPAEVSV
ncbi:MAG TPA: hypothetical protein VGN16_21180 [Acidobacteriaceae bacterium]|jgi:hypothetical protein